MPHPRTQAALQHGHGHRHGHRAVQAVNTLPIGSKVKPNLGSISVCSGPDALAQNFVATSNSTDTVCVGDYISLEFSYDRESIAVESRVCAHAVTCVCAPLIAVESRVCAHAVTCVRARARRRVSLRKHRRPLPGTLTCRSRAHPVLAEITSGSVYFNATVRKERVGTCATIGRAACACCRRRPHSLLLLRC